MQDFIVENTHFWDFSLHFIHSKLIVFSNENDKMYLNQFFTYLLSGWGQQQRLLFWLQFFKARPFDIVSVIYVKLVAQNIKFKLNQKLL